MRIRFEIEIDFENEIGNGKWKWEWIWDVSRETEIVLFNILTDWGNGVDKCFLI